MSKGIYPLRGRFNFLAGMYCEMAMEAYDTVAKQYDILLKKDSWVDSIADQEKFEKAMISCVVFSAMSIEAYLNDYAASCLGDSEFYKYFDKLSITGKLELITKFILQAPLDKSRETYRNIKMLVQDRNAFVHSKSTSCEYPKYTKEELEARNEYWEENIANIEEPQMDLESISKSLEKAENALKAIHGIAVHFDKNDTNAHAEVFLFAPSHIYFDPSGQANYREKAFELLKIKVPKNPYT